MAEPKRIQLDAPKTLHREKKTKALPPTYRFDLKLTDTKNSDCAEYSYAELVKEARSAENDSKHPGSDDPFSLDDDDQKLQEIARRYEEKYNPKPGRKKKKKLTVSEDYIDKGMGYDETDPFIDNDEAYDELVPSTLTTQFGGFYINKGDLEFRNLGDDGGYDSKVRKKRFKGMDKESRKKRRLGTDENQKRRGRKPMNDSTSALIKPAKKTQPTVADMLQQHKAKLQLMQQEGFQQIQLNPISIEREIEPEEVEENYNNIIIINNNNITEAPVVPAAPPGQGSTISEAIESVVKAAAEDASNESAGPGTGSSDNEEVKPPLENIEAPKLPDNLPPELDDVVSKLKAVAFKSEEGKCKFFSEEVNRMLLSIELKAQELTSAQRSLIYSHLAKHLPCTKETLQKRAKKLRLDQEDGKLKEPMQRLKDGIAAVMPEMLEKYAAVLKACDAKEEDKKNENATGVSEGEGSDEEGEKKPSRVPRKHFEWNDTIRRYLCDVVRIKLKCYEVSKTRIQSAEEYLKHFLEAEVKNLWPPGWMQSRILFRESRPAHFYITNRPKKQILVPKKTNPLSSVPLTTKPAISILNNAVSQESEFDQIFQDKSVPLIPPVENVLERRENLDLLASNNGISTEERVAEYTKLFTLPIQSTVPDDLSVSKNLDNVSAQTNAAKASVDPPTTSSPLAITKTDAVVLSKSSAKSDKHTRLIQQNKVSPFPPKVADYSAFAAEGSLASDMLARIICASLADYPYSGSHNIESASPKTHSVISPNPSLIKEAHTINSKFANDLHTSPKKLESAKSVVEKKKTSQEIASHMSSAGLNMDLLLNMKSQNVSRQSDPGIIVKNKGLPSENSTAVNLKVKDSIVPHSRQFAEAFERTADTVSKKHSVKGLSVHPQSSISSCSSSRLLNVAEHLSDYPSSTSPRASLDSAQKIALELANKYSNTTQGTATAPYKKRTKYASSSKINDHWTQLFDASVGSSLLEGMKGFPFPVSLPTPPPAHSSSPHRTAAHSPHNSSRTSSHISAGLRSIHESKSDTPNHNSQTHPNIITVSDVQRRQSLIQGPWKSNPSSQASSTSSLSHFMASTSPPISNQCKPTSPNHHGSNSHVNMSPVPAHSMSQIDKVSTPYSRSHSPLPPRASPSHLSAIGHTSKTPPSNSYSSHLGQASYSTHQSSHSVSQTIHQAVARSNNIFDPSNSVNSSSSTGTLTLNLNQEMKTVNPRTN